jgi:hypothetical protein
LAGKIFTRFRRSLVLERLCVQVPRTVFFGCFDEAFCKGMVNNIMSAITSQVGVICIQSVRCPLYVAYASSVLEHESEI